MLLGSRAICHPEDLIKILYKRGPLETQSQPILKLNSRFKAEKFLGDKEQLQAAVRLQKFQFPHRN